MVAENKKDFFVSYSNNDQLWAEWIIYQLNKAGYSVISQATHFHVGSNFVLEMHNASIYTQRTLIILSPDYMASPYASIEWAAALTQDPTGERRILVPVRVRVCDPPGLLAAITYIDIVGLDEQTAQQIFLARLHQAGMYPGPPPAFPGLGGTSDTGINTPTEMQKLDGVSTTNLQEDRPRRNDDRAWTIAHQSNRWFIGRNDILEHLYTVFHDENSPVPLVLSGLSGIGKTQTAIEYAYRYRDSYQAVLWASAESLETLHSDFMEIARELNLPEMSVKDQKIVVLAVKRWLETNTRWLLILDNVSNLGEIQNVLPGNNKGHVLLTTQAQDTGGIAQRIEVTKMSADESALFLLRRAGKLAPGAPLTVATQEDQVSAEEIAIELLDGVPLALEQAGAYIEANKCSLSNYIDLYKKNNAELLKQYKGFVSKHPPIATTLSLSIEQVEVANPAAADLLRICAFLYPDDIPLEIIAERTRDKDGHTILGQKLYTCVADALKLNRAIEELLKFSLVQRNQASENTLTIHRLVQTVLLTRMKNVDKTKNASSRWAKRAVQAVSRTFCSVEVAANWHLCERYLPHAQRCAEHIKSEDMVFIEAAHLLHRTGLYLFERAQYLPAQEYLLRARRMYEQTVEVEEVEMANVLDSLGRLCAEQCKYDEASVLYEQALAILEQMSVQAPAALAHCLSHQALLYYNQGKYTEAEPIYLRALRMLEQVLGAEHIEVAVTLNYLAWLYYNLGQYDKTEALLERAHAILERHKAQEDPVMARTINAQAMLYRAKGEYEQAERYYLRALEIREKVLGQEHPDVATTLNDIAWLYRTQGRYQDAEELYQRVRAIREHVLGYEHLHLATTLNDIAVLYVDQGRYNEALALYQRALAIREHVLGKEHPRVGTTIYNMGWLYYQQGRYAQAEQYHTQALAIREETLDSESRYHIARSLNALAEVYRVRGTYVAAEEKCLEALEIRRQILPPTHRNIIISLNHLALLYMDIGCYIESEALYQEALELYAQARAREPLHPRIRITLLNDLALLYMQQGRYRLAEGLYRKALAQQQQYGPDHPDMATLLNNLAALYTHLEQYEQADPFFTRAIALREHLLGTDHPLLAQSYHDRALYFHMQGKHSEAERFYHEALLIREKMLGAEHPYVAQTYNDLALLCIHLDRYSEAEDYAQKALKICQRAFAFRPATQAGYPEYPLVARVLNTLGASYACQGRDTLAARLYEQALLINTQMLGEEHPHIALVLENYALLKRRSQDEEEARALETRFFAIRERHARENIVCDGES